MLPITNFGKSKFSVKMIRNAKGVIKFVYFLQLLAIVSTS